MTRAEAERLKQQADGGSGAVLTGSPEELERRRKQALAPGSAPTAAASPASTAPSSLGTSPATGPLAPSPTPAPTPPAARPAPQAVTGGAPTEPLTPATPAPDTHALPDPTSPQGGPTDGLDKPSPNFVPPDFRGTLEQAQQYLQSEARRLLGRDLTPAELQEAAAFAGYTGGEVTGAQMNAVLTELMRRIGGGDPTTRVVPTEPPSGGTPPAGTPPPMGIGPSPGYPPIAPLSTRTRTPSAYETAIRDKILALLGQDPSNVSLNDPNLLPQMNAFERQQQRGFDTRRSVMAERAAQEGTLNSGGFDAGIERAAQDWGEASANYGADLVGQEVTARRNEVMQALQLGKGLLDTDTETQLRRELADLDAQLRRQGFDVQERLGQGDLDLRKLLGGQQYDLGLGDLSLRRLLGEGGMGLNLLSLLLTDSQFNDKLGFDIGAFSAEQQRLIWQTLLGG